MPYLLDTNVVSEFRKGKRANPGVQAWRQNVAQEETFTSVIVMGELRRGIEKLRVRDRVGAQNLDHWFNGIRATFAGNVLPVTAETCHLWGANRLFWPLEAADALIAATAQLKGLTVVTRNERDFQRSGVDFINPFTP
jgi:predicted nucleic acid-binding protein